MLSVYDLYDLYAIFVGIRFAPDGEINVKIMESVICVLRNRHESSEPNQFRVALKPLNHLDTEKIYEFTLTENRYCYYPLPFLKDERIYAVLLEACNKLMKAIKAHDSDKIVALADCLHNLPTLIAECNNKIPKSFWSNEVEFYRKRFDETFLIREQKTFAEPKLYSLYMRCKRIISK